MRTKFARAYLDTVSAHSDRILAHFAKYKDSSNYGERPSPLLTLDVVQKILSIVNNDLKASRKFKGLHEFELKAQNKWFGIQGGVPSLADLQASSDPYYDKSNLNPDIADVNDGIQYVQDLFKSVGIEKGCLSAIDPRLIVSEYSNKANSGIYWWADKTDYLTKKVTIKNLEQFNDFFPSVLMHRYMRNKLRAVFNDEFANYSIAASIVNPVMSVITSLPMWTTMFKGRYKFQQVIHNRLSHNTRTLEADAEAMDTTVSWTTVTKIVEPILFYLFRESDHAFIKEVNKNLFFNDLIIGSSDRRTGEHTLFSGQSITSLYETLIQIVGFADTFLKIRSLRNPQTTLLDDSWIEVIGDDSACFLHPIYSPIERILTPWGDLEWIDLSTLVLQRVGLKARRDKQRTSVGDVIYCKRFYSPSLITVTNVAGVDIHQSARPLTLTLNGGIWPEFGPGDNIKQELIRLLQVFDEAYGHPKWITMMDIIKSYWSKDILAQDLSQEVVWFNKKRLREFKHRLNGDQFTLAGSISYQYLLTGRIIAPNYLTRL
jgi:hypothetical protein